MPPGIAAAATVLVLLALGVRQEYALIAFGLAAAVTAGIFVEWYRGTRSRQRSSGEIYPLAFLRLIAANRPRYGGYIVHLSIVMVALGVVGTTFFSTQKDVVLAPGDTVVVDDYEIRYIGTTEIPWSNRTDFISSVEVYRDGNLLEIIKPNRSFYPSFNMASTRAAIRSTPVEDLFIVPSENLDNGSVGFRILINPLIWWMWVAGPVLVLGTVVALWPQRVRQTATAKAPGRVSAGPRASTA
jgi:cytochrome c-type biogenesis protein CcmF